MRQVKYLLKTKRYYFITILLFIFSISIALSFNNSWSKNFETIKTYDNFSANNIAYDDFSEKKDSYANFEYSIKASKNNVEGEIINAHIYQFLDDTIYTNKSIINEKNVTEGKYKVLEKNEIAIPIAISNENELYIGDIVYVDLIPCVIKYIFRDIYQVRDINYSIMQTVIFVGKNTIELDNSINYCNFDPGDTMHRNIVNINILRRRLNKEISYLNLGIIMASIFTILVVLKLVNKHEKNAFRVYRYAGGRMLFLRLLVVELTLLLPTFLFSGLVFMLLNINLKILVYTFLIYFILGLINQISLYFELR